MANGHAIESGMVNALTLCGRAVAGLGQQIQQERARWFLWLPVGFGFGIVAYFSGSAEPHLLQAFIPLLLAATLYAALSQFGAQTHLAVALLSIAAGYLCSKIQTIRSEAPKIERRMFGVEVTGFIERIEPRPSRGPRVTLTVIKLGRLSAAQTPHRVRVRLLSPAKDIKPGMAVMLKAVLAPPARPAIPGGYDFARSAYYQRIGAVGYARGSPTPITIDVPPPFSLRLRAAIERFRAAIGQRITTTIGGETGAIANALMTGERGQISEAIKEAYRDSGLLHILSISGLHMAIMGGTVFYAIRLLLAAFPVLALQYPTKKWAAAVAIVASLGYLLVSGTAHATQRAFIMILIMMIAVMCDRPAIAMRNVALAALIILGHGTNQLVACRLPNVVFSGDRIGGGLRGLCNPAAPARPGNSARNCHDRCPVLRSHCWINADRQPRGRTSRRLPLSQEPAVCDPRELDRGPNLQSGRDAGSARNLCRHAVWHRSCSAMGNGAWD